MNKRVILCKGQISAIGVNKYYDNNLCKEQISVIGVNKYYGNNRF